MRITNKQIAVILRGEAAKLPEHSDALVTLFSIKIDNILIKCRPNSEALLKVAAKFDKRYRFVLPYPRKLSTKRPAKFSQAIYNRFINSGEYANADQYKLLYQENV